MRKGRFEQWEKDLIKERRNNNIGYNEIAKELNRTKDSVSGYCRDNGLSGDRGSKEYHNKRTKLVYIPKEKIEKECLYCGNKFLTHNGKYCSEECSNKYRNDLAKRKRKKDHDKAKKTCVVCGELLPFGKSKYCSEECRNNKYSKVCEWCGKGYTTNDKLQKYCSRDCQFSWMRENEEYTNQFGDMEHRENKFKIQFEKLNPNFKYHSEYKSSEDYFKSECKLCGYVEERHAQVTRPSREHVEVRCTQCVKISQLRADLISLMNRRINKLKWEQELERRELQRQKDLITVCEECGKTFKANQLGMKYCSIRCSRRMSNRARDKYRVDRIIANGNIDKDITLTKLIKRDKGLCHICNGKCDRKDYTKTIEGYFIVGKDYPSIDHIVPISKGGTHTWDNIKLAHHYCNTIKNDKEVYEEGTGQLKIVI